jgi:flagellar biosynthesis GTPase FlhF
MQGAAYSSDESCTSADVEANVRLTVYSGAGRTACEGIDRVFGQRGAYWRVQPVDAALEGELVCSLAKNRELVEVRDTGGHYYGNRFCAALTGKGWTEQEGPGSEVEREMAQHESVATAAAAAKAHEEEVERDHTEALQQKNREAAESQEHAAEEAREKKEETQQKSQQAHEEAERKTETAHEEAEQHHEQEKLEHEEAERQKSEARERQKEASERAAEQSTSEEERRSSDGEATGG